MQKPQLLNVLTVSDEELGLIYSAQIKQRFAEIDVVLSCGDLPYFYLEYIISMLNVPLYYVLGNHMNREEISHAGSVHGPPGGINLHRRSVMVKGMLVAGIEGCAVYNDGPYQYTQSQMWMHAYILSLQLLLNRILYGRYLDVFISHAPPWKIHDMEDPAHHGIRAFNWLNKTFKPMYHFHGHTHVLRNDAIRETWAGRTLVVNTYGYRETLILPYIHTGDTNHSPLKKKR